MSSLKEHQVVLLELLGEFDRICRKIDVSYSLFAGSALGAVRHGGFIPWDDDLDVVMLRTEYEKFLRYAPGVVDPKYYIQGEFSNNWPMHFSKLRKNNTTCLEKYHPKIDGIHQGIYIDIFPCDNISDVSVVRRIQYYASRMEIAGNIFKRGYETDSLLKKCVMGCCCVLPRKLLNKIAIQKNKADSRYVHTFYGGSCQFKKGIYPREWFTNLQEIRFENLSVYISSHYDKLLMTMYGDYMTLPPEEDRKCKVHAILVDTERSYTEYKDYRDGMKFDVYTRSIR